MTSLKNNKKSSITYIGGGFTSIFNIYQLAKKITSSKTSEKISLCLDPDLIGSMAYHASFSPPPLLLHQTLNKIEASLTQNDFPSLKGFVHKKQKALIEEFSAQSGISRKWVTSTKGKQSLENIQNPSEWAHEHLPRAFFGAYLQDLLWHAVQLLQDKKYDIEIIKGHVEKIEPSTDTVPDGNTYPFLDIHCENAEKFTPNCETCSMEPIQVSTKNSKFVITSKITGLFVGRGPLKSVPGSENLPLQGKQKFIDGLTNATENIPRLQQLIEDGFKKDKAVEVSIIGNGASMEDVIRTIYTLFPEELKANKIHITIHGQKGSKAIRNSTAPQNPNKKDYDISDFQTKLETVTTAKDLANLYVTSFNKAINILDTETYSEEIKKFSKGDFRRRQYRTYTASHLHQKLYPLLKTKLNQLLTEERVRFYNEGIPTPNEMINKTKMLESQSACDIFTDIWDSLTFTGQRVEKIYHTANGGIGTKLMDKHQQPADIIVNASGYENSPENPLIKSTMRNLGGTLNKTGRGFEIQSNPYGKIILPTDHMIFGHGKIAEDSADTNPFTDDERETSRELGLGENKKGRTTTTIPNEASTALLMAESIIPILS